MEQLTPSPITVTASAIIMQVSVTCILVGALLILRMAMRHGDAADPSALFVPSIIAVVVAFAVLALSEPQAAASQPLLRIGLSGLRWSIAMPIVFVVDILWIALLVAATGGSQESPFTPVFFALPALSIFLREPLGYIILYLFLMLGAFTLTRRREQVPWRRRARGVGAAFWWVSVTCAGLTAVLGILTRR